MKTILDIRTLSCMFGTYCIRADGSQGVKFEYDLGHVLIPFLLSYPRFIPMSSKSKRERKKNETTLAVNIILSLEVFCE